MNAFAKKLMAGAAVATLVLSTGGSVRAQGKDIVDTAVGAGQFKTLAAALQAAGLVGTLKGKGPFTVFAPTDAAFAKLPAGTVETLLKPENKSTLTKILTYHVVAGNWDAKSIIKAIKKNNGSYEMTTVSGGKLWATLNGPMNVVLKDEKGNYANISTYDVRQSNGVIHVIDRVLLPGM